MKKELTAVEWFYQNVQKIEFVNQDDYENLFVYYFQAKQIEHVNNIEYYVKNYEKYLKVINQIKFNEDEKNIKEI